MATVPDQEIRRSTFGLVRDVVLSLTRMVEDSAEFVGTSVREELARFRTEVARQAISLVAVVVGASLLSAGTAMFVSRFLGSWPLTLVIFGAIYLMAGLALSRGVGSNEDKPR